MAIKCGIVGLPNVGKSTLINRLVGTKISIVSPKVQTTRSRVRGIRVVGAAQLVLVDTPGIFQGAKHRLERAMVHAAWNGAQGADAILLLIDAERGLNSDTRRIREGLVKSGRQAVMAINKIDKPGANPENVKRELAELNLVPEDWGGHTVMVPVSAKKRENLDQLLEMILLSTDILELKANPRRPASGTVLEAKLEDGRGPVAQVLVRQGCLKKGDFIVAGRAFGRVRDIINDRGKRINEAQPSAPVAISGIGEVPDAGDKFYVVTSLKAAEAAAQERARHDRERRPPSQPNKGGTEDNGEQGRREPFADAVLGQKHGQRRQLLLTALLLRRFADEQADEPQDHGDGQQPAGPHPDAAVAGGDLGGENGGGPAEADDDDDGHADQRRHGADEHAHAETGSSAVVRFDDHGHRSRRADGGGHFLARSFDRCGFEESRRVRRHLDVLLAGVDLFQQLGTE